MPHVIVKMYPGRTAEQKRVLTDEIVKAVKTALGSVDASISVSIEDVAPADWAKKVYEPDILAKPETLHKRPG